MTQPRNPLQARISETQAAALYDRLARVYDIWGVLTESKARQRALDLAAVESGHHVLEVAVGTGLAFAKIVGSNPGGRNVGIDISAGMLAKAEGRLRQAGLTNYELAVGRASSIQAETGSVDVLLNNYMFDLLDEDAWPGVLTEFRRVLKPGGRLVLVNMTFGERAGSGIYDRLYQWSPSLMGGCRGVRVAGVLGASGFRVHLREYWQQLLFPSEVILSTSPVAAG